MERAEIEARLARVISAQLAGASKSPLDQTAPTAFIHDLAAVLFEAAGQWGADYAPVLAQRIYDDTHTAIASDGARAVFGPLRAAAIAALETRKALIRSHNPNIKTEGTYRRQVWRVVRELYGGEIDEFTFIDDMSAFIDNQFSRAWNAGAREMGVDPRQFTDADITALAERIAAERDYMLGLADDILNARAGGTGADQFRTRAEMYANRYNDVLNEARVHFGGKQYLEWVVGPTEHCTDCARLNGVVATAEDWEASGWRPQSRDLECGGYHCQCDLRPTSKPPTDGGIPG